MKLEEYEQIMRTGTPSDRARAIAAANDDKELSEEEFHQLTALIKGAVRPSARKMTPDEAKLWAEVSRVNTRLKQEMVAASFTVRALPGDLQEDAINTLSKTVSGMLGDLSRHKPCPGKHCGLGNPGGCTFCRTRKSCVLHC